MVLVISALSLTHSFHVKELPDLPEEIRSGWSQEWISRIEGRRGPPVRAPTVEVGRGTHVNEKEGHIRGGVVGGWYQEYRLPTWLLLLASHMSVLQSMIWCVYWTKFSHKNKTQPFKNIYKLLFKSYICTYMHICTICIHMYIHCTPYTTHPSAAISYTTDYYITNSKQILVVFTWKGKGSEILF